MDKLIERLRAVAVGPGLEDPDLGPLISATQRDRVAAMVADAAESADGRLRVGGEVPSQWAKRDFFYAASIIDEVDRPAPISQEETFDPVFAVLPFDGEGDAVELANGTDFGLIAVVWTSHLGQAHRMARALEAGQIFVNTDGAGGGAELPFGGLKRSGHGREKGFEGLLNCTQTKSVVVQL